MRKTFDALVGNVFSAGEFSVGGVTASAESTWNDLHPWMAGSIATSNGTTALELAARAFTVRAGVAVVPDMAPPMVEWALAKAGFVVCRAGVSSATGNITAAALRAFRVQVAVVVVVHNAGVVCEDLQEIREWCDKRGAALVEDCSHAHLCDGAGALGDAAAWSFYPTKVLASSEGGIVSFRSATDFAKMRVYANQGKERGSGNFGPDGYNLRISELSACLMLAEIMHRDVVVGDRIAQARAYRDAGVRLTQPDGSTYYKFTFLAGSKRQADAFRAGLRKAGYPESGATYRPENLPNVLFMENSRRYAAQHVNLPYARFDGRAEERAEAVARVMRDVVGGCDALV